MSDPPLGARPKEFPPNKAQQSGSQCVFSMEWISPLQNEITQIKYSPYELQYDLGSGNCYEDPDEAMDHFLTREFEEIIQRNIQPHQVIFSPDSYLYKELTEKVFVKKAVGNKDTQEVLEQHSKNLSGLMLEEEVFHKLKKLFADLNVVNTVVLTNWESRKKETITGCEFDFLIVSEPLRTVIHIEVKTTSNTMQIERSKKQLKKGFSVLTSKIPFGKEKNWRHCKVMLFAEKDANKNCSCCSLNVLSKETDFLNWWTELTNKLKHEKPQKQSDTYCTILKFLFHQTYIQKGVITKSDLTSYTAKKISASSTAERVIMWSTEQLNLLEPNEHTRVIFTSLYGTGKTILLKAKAKQLAKEKANVVIVIFEDPETTIESLLTREYRNQFGDTVIIIGLKTKDIATELTDMMTKYENAHFFMDEVPLQEDSLNIETLKNLASNILGDNQYLWIACQAQLSVNQNSLKGFEFPQLDMPLRYSSYILRVAKTVKTQIGSGDTDFPQDLRGEMLFSDILNTGTKPCFLPNDNIATAIEEVVNMLKKLDCQTIIKVDFQLQKIKTILSLSSINERIVFDDKGTEEEMNLFFRQSNKKILVVTSKNDAFLRGFEVNCLVLITSNLQGTHNDTAFSRCKSNLIIVTNKTDIEKLKSDQEGRTVLQTIEIKNEMPKNFEEAIRQDKTDVININLTGVNHLNVDVRNNEGQTGLIIACIEQALGAVEIFIQKGANVNAKDPHGWGAVQYAVKMGNLECLKLLLEKKANLNAITNKGENILQLAVHHNNLNILDHLLNIILPNLIEVQLSRLRSSIIEFASKPGVGNVILHLIKNGTTFKEGEMTTAILEESIKQNEPAAISFLYKGFANLTFDQKNASGQTGLMIACAHKAEKSVELFLLSGCNVNAKDLNGWSPIHYAIKGGSVQVLDIIIRLHRADMTATTSSHQNAFHLAMLYNQFNALAYMLNFVQIALFLDAKNKSPFCVGVENGSYKALETLVFYKSKCPFVTDDYQELSLFDIIETCIGAQKRGTRLDYDQMLRLAIPRGQFEVIKYLIKHKGANPNSKGKNGKTAAHLAVYFGSIECLELLQAYGTNMNEEDDDGWSPVHHAAKGGKLNCLQWLHRNGANITATTNNWQTAIHIAVFFDKSNILDYLLQFDEIDLDLEDDEQKTALDISIQECYYNLAEKLVETGEIMNGDHQEFVQIIEICIDAQKRGTLLDYDHMLRVAIPRGQFEVIKYLIKHKGANPNSKGKNGKTAAHLAVYFGSIECLELLQAYGTNMNEEDDDGWSPVHHAAKGGKLNCLQWLLRNGANITATNL